MRIVTKEEFEVRRLTQMTTVLSRQDAYKEKIVIVNRGTLKGQDRSMNFDFKSPPGIPVSAAEAESLKNAFVDVMHSMRTDILDGLTIENFPGMNPASFLIIPMAWEEAIPDTLYLVWEVADLISLENRVTQFLTNRSKQSEVLAVKMFRWWGTVSEYFAVALSEEEARVLIDKSVANSSTDERADWTTVRASEADSVLNINETLILPRHP